MLWFWSWTICFHSQWAVGQMAFLPWWWQVMQEYNAWNRWWWHGTRPAKSKGWHVCHLDFRILLEVETMCFIKSSMWINVILCIGHSDDTIWIGSKHLLHLKFFALFSCYVLYFIPFNLLVWKFSHALILVRIYLPKLSEWINYSESRKDIRGEILILYFL